MNWKSTKFVNLNPNKRWTILLLLLSNFERDLSRTSDFNKHLREDQAGPCLEQLKRSIQCCYVTGIITEDYRHNIGQICAVSQPLCCSTDNPSPRSGLICSFKSHFDRKQQLFTAQLFLSIALFSINILNRESDEARQRHS